ncbi:MAG TPA: hypothetical protein VKQ36_05675, partial [Ktedonobacterales bacterium]|nr:hypothetical protein [Ktedonobacterales bacterium]
MRHAHPTPLTPPDSQAETTSRNHKPAQKPTKVGRAGQVVRPQKTPRKIVKPETASTANGHTMPRADSLITTAAPSDLTAETPQRQNPQEPPESVESLESLDAPDVTDVPDVAPADALARVNHVADETPAITNEAAARQLRRRGVSPENTVFVS